jgi:hypothetical protein
MEAALHAFSNRSLRAPVSVTAGGHRWEQQGVDHPPVGYGL